MVARRHRRATTTPAASWPSTTGGSIGLVPSITLRSLWQMPDAST